MNTPSPQTISDQDIVDAYHYMLSRWLVLRQVVRDLKQGLRWNEITHHTPGGVAWANPNLDLAYSEGWVYVDDSTCTIVELPEIKGRYYTMQLCDGWGDVVTNINERNYPQHPSGKFALCRKGSDVTLPPDTLRIDLPGRKSRVLMRIEVGANPAEAAALQKQVTMKAAGSPTVEPPPAIFDFPNDKLPGVEAFDHTEAILASEPDIITGMDEPRRKARMVAKAATDPSQRARIDDVIRTQAIPTFMAGSPRRSAAVNGWAYPRIARNYGSDFLGRSFANYSGMWANNPSEVVYFGSDGIDGSKTYTQTYPKEALPKSKARYFWSVIAVDNATFHVIPNPLQRYLLNRQSPLQYNADGSLTLAFALAPPAGVPESNWLPTPANQKYTLTYRFYGPTEDVVSGKYYPPPLLEQK